MVSSSVRSVLFNSFVPCVTVVFLFCTFELVSITTADGSVGAGSLGPVVVLGSTIKVCSETACSTLDTVSISAGFGTGPGVCD
jgi:ABC-type methionine transport system permease subunit